MPTHVPYNTDPLYLALLERLPKIDLHTHLNGSISNALLQYLAALLYGADSSIVKVFQHTEEEGPAPTKGTSSGSGSVGDAASVLPDRTTALFTSAATEIGVPALDNNPQQGATEAKAAAANDGGGLPSDPAARMHYCFAVFDAIYKVMNNLAFTRAACQDVLWHYAAERAVYVEIRTSIRGGMYPTFAAQKAAVGGATADSVSAAAATCSQLDYWRAVTDTIESALTLKPIASSSSGGTTSVGRLPSFVSLSPPFSMIEPSEETLVKTRAYIEGLAAWEALYAGKGLAMATAAEGNCGAFSSSPSSPSPHASFVEQFIASLRKEAETVAAPMTRGDAAAANATSNASTEETPLPTPIAIIDRLRVRMLLSISRGQSIADAKATASIIPQVFAKDSLKLEEHRRNHRAETAAKRLRTEVNTNNDDDDASEVSNSRDAVVRLTASAASCVFPILVGIDLGGSAYKGHLPDIIGFLEEIRELHQLPFTLHGGEKKDDAEMLQMMTFRPERWGHLVFVSDEHREALQSIIPLSQKYFEDGNEDCCLLLEPRTTESIPSCHFSSYSLVSLASPPPSCVELCLTSNMITNGSDDVTEHHISKWLGLVAAVSDNGGEEVETSSSPSSSSSAQLTKLCPKGTSHISLHTDDRGVFSSSLTRELWLFSQHLELFSEAQFGPIGSLARCEALLPIIIGFHRDAMRVVFAPPSATLSSASPSVSSAVVAAYYRREALNRFDEAYQAMRTV